jgi:hypothetical protein
MPACHPPKGKHPCRNLRPLLKRFALVPNPERLVPLVRIFGEAPFPHKSLQVLLGSEVHNTSFVVRRKSGPGKELHFTCGTAKSDNENADTQTDAANNAFSKKLESHRAAIALQFAYYNCAMLLRKEQSASSAVHRQPI